MFFICLFVFNLDHGNQSGVSSPHPRSHRIAQTVGCSVMGGQLHTPASWFYDPQLYPSWGSKVKSLVPFQNPGSSVHKIGRWVTNGLGTTHKTVQGRLWGHLFKTGQAEINLANVPDTTSYVLEITVILPVI